jgi:hypothetical protein
MALTKEERAEIARANMAKAREARAAKKIAALADPATAEPSIAVAEGGEPALMPALEIDPETLEADPAFEALDAFDRYLSGLDAETRELLGEDELRRIYAENEKKALEEKRTARRQVARERALQHAKIEAGLMPVTAIEHQKWLDRMNEKVSFVVDLPEFSDVGLRIDGIIYLHGFRYTVTRAQYESFRDIIYRARQAELDFEGRGRSHWLRKQATGTLGERLDA